MLEKPNIPQQYLNLYRDRFQCAIDNGMFKPRGGCPGNQAADAPWLQKPPQYLEINYVDSLAISQIPAATDTLVVSFKTKLGLDGVIGALSNQLNGEGFLEGSGSIIWRLKVGTHWVDNFEDIRVTLGTTDNPFIFGRGGIRFRENMTVGLYVYIPDPSLFQQTDRVIGGLYGWYYNMEAYSRVYN